MILVRVDNVMGDVKIKGYENWFVAETIGFGVGRKVKADNNAKDIEEERPEEQELSINKTIDAATVYLMHFAMKGRTNANASRPVCIDIHLLQNRQLPGKPDLAVSAYLKIRIENAIITEWGIDASGDERPTEDLKFWFNRAAMKYRALNEEKKAGSNDLAYSFVSHGPLGWDQQANKEWTPDKLKKDE